jgi:nucleoside-diphosphate-sugar epimerase
MTRLAAVTGATGFLGRYIVRALTLAGWRVRILTRQRVDHPQLRGLKLEAVVGDLSNRRVLRALVDGADAVIHAAGLIKAPTAADFWAVNVGGAANLAMAITDGKPASRVLMVSSIAARERHLSAYSQTKRAGEEVLTSILRHRSAWTIVRPSAIYGPWDRETLAIFRAISRRIFLRPHVPHARVALIHAADAAAGIAGLALAERNSAGAILELTDERTQGYSWDEIISVAETALGLRTLAIPVPGMIIRAAAAINVATARSWNRTPMLTPGKAREILHANWGSTVERQPPSEVWRPTIGLAQGFRDTVCWYRDRHWLPAAASSPAVGDARH